MRKCDLIYNGSIEKWEKFANVCCSNCLENQYVAPTLSKVIDSVKNGHFLIPTIIQNAME